MLKPERSGLIDMLISSDDSEEIVKARCHYTRAEVDGIIYDLYYDVHVQGNTVAYEEGVRAQLENKLFLKDATSDLPAVTNSEMRYEMPYGGTPTTEFQHMIRLKRLSEWLFIISIFITTVFDQVNALLLFFFNGNQSRLRLVKSRIDLVGSPGFITRL